MRIFPWSGRGAPLMAALLLSAGAHLLLLLIAERGRRIDPAAAASPALQLRLRAAQPRAALEVPPAPPAEAAQATATGVAPAAPAAASGQPQAAATAPPGPVPAPAFAVAVAPGEQLDLMSEVQLRYPTTMPPSALLAYRVTGAGTGPGADTATLNWTVENGDSYRLDYEGPGQVTRSQGSIGDGGISPASASDERAGGVQRTYFDRAARQLAFSATHLKYPMIDSVQDRLSVLMQLAAVGLANPQRLAQPIVFVVGGAAGVATVRFDPAGSETIESGLGRIEALRFIVSGTPGAGRLEVWLSPSHHWLPLQLRSSAADGSVTTHTATRIELGGAAPP